MSHQKDGISSRNMFVTVNLKKKKKWAFENPNQLFSKMSPSSVPLDLAALRGLLAHRCFFSGLVSKSRGGDSVQAPPKLNPAAMLTAGSRGRCPPRRCGAGEGSRWTEDLSSPHRPLLFITHRKKPQA